MAFLINHGEKIVAAVFAMLGCLALSSANWATTDQSPIALEKTANENKAKIELNDWPEEDKQWFQEIPDVLKITSEEGGEIVNVADYQMAPFRQILSQAKEKRTAVSVLAPQEARAVAVVFPLAMPPDEEEEDGEMLADAGTAEGDAKAEDVPLTEEEESAKLLAEKFGLRPADAAASGGLGGSSGFPGEPGMDEYAQEMEGMEPGYGGGDEYGMEYGMEMFDQYGEGLTNVTKKNIRVSAGVSATMIIDLQKQREIVRKALHLKGNYLIAQNEIMYVDLLVERRSAGPKTGNWEPVSSEDLAEILTESLGFDRDVVSPAITRSAITMPLPRRAAGVWQASEVSHPRVEDFELSREEKELIDKFNQMVTAKISEAEEAAPIEIAPRGFSGFATSATEMNSYGMGGSGMESGYDEMYDEYEGSMGSMGGAGSTPFKLSDAEKQLLDATKATAEHRLLLVRFMDFTVERGKSYEYRARVVMKNPNYDFPLDELDDPGLAAEPELVSAWSEATNPVFVPFGSRSYLTEVDARSGEQEKASIRVYSDTTETGLSVMGPVKVFVGMPIAGMHSLEVVDLTSDKLENREVTLRTDELLAAAEELDRLSTTDHPELKKMLDRLDRSVKPIADQVTVVDNTGALKLRSSGDMAQQESADYGEYTGILKIYEPWKKKASSGSADSDFFGPGEEDMMMEGGDEYGLGMEAASSSSYQGGRTAGGRRMSSREEARKRRSGELPPRGGSGMGSGYSE